MMLPVIFSWMTLLTFGLDAHAGLCQEWGVAEQVGELDRKLIGESSGLAVSSDGQRLYHINDSGDGPFFYVTDLNGKKTQKVRFDKKDPVDMEAIAVGRCPSSEQKCLFLGDIGDNRGKRNEIQVTVIEDKSQFEDSVTPIGNIFLKYPDKARNSEAFAVHPNGDLFIITKEYDFKGGKPLPARVFRLARSSWGKLGTGAGSKAATLEAWGEIDLPRLSEPTHPRALVTDFSIHPDGKRFLVLTYDKAVEFAVSLEEGRLRADFKWIAGRNYRVVDLKTLLQQESLTYLQDGRGFLYSTEIGLATLLNFVPPLMRVRCLK